MRTTTIEVRIGSNMIYHPGIAGYRASHRDEAEKARRLKQDRDDAEKRRKEAAQRKTESMTNEYRAAWGRIKSIETTGVDGMIAAQSAAHAMTPMQRVRARWSEKDVKCFRKTKPTGGAACGRCQGMGIITEESTCD